MENIKMKIGKEARGYTIYSPKRSNKVYGDYGKGKRKVYIGNRKSWSKELGL